MRRRIKPKVAWFPQDPDFTKVTPEQGVTNVLELAIQVAGANNSIVTGAVPVVYDQTHFPDGSGGVNSLSDIENSGYRLRRIVGKCFCSVHQLQDNTTPTAFLCAAAFIVLRTADNGQPSQDLQSYNLFEIGNSDSPYIWRREWVLINAQASEPNPALNDYPFTNAEYGSVADGPHIDQKTARVIGKDERLFFVASAMILSGGSVEGNPGEARFIVTPRILGSMRATLGNRRNASR